MRRVFGDALVSIGALAVLLLALIVIDGRVREQVSLRFSDHETQLVGAGGQVRGLASIVVDVVRDQSTEHAPLMIMVVAATVLVVFMLRT